MKKKKTLLGTSIPCPKCHFLFQWRRKQSEWKPGSFTLFQIKRSYFSALTLIYQLFFLSFSDLFFRMKKQVPVYWLLQSVKKQSGQGNSWGGRVRRSKKRYIERVCVSYELSILIFGTERERLKCVEIIAKSPATDLFSPVKNYA